MTLSARGRTHLLWLFSTLSACSDCGGEGRRANGDNDAGPLPDAQLGQACNGAPYRCEDGRALPCEPDAGEAVDCAAAGRSCDTLLGCVECTPGEASCSEGRATWCSPEGKLLAFECDEVQGLTCSPDGCTGACSLDQIHHSYIGCDYYPTITLNPVWSGFPFAVAVSNASEQETEVTITRGEQVVLQETVAAGELQTFELDWIPELKGGDVECTTPPAAGASRLVADGAYRVRTTQPVTVYQFSPLEYQLMPAPTECPALSQCQGSAVTDCWSYSNDASMLLPATALTGSYTVLAWPTQQDGAGFVAVTATEDGTRVELRGSAGFESGGGIDASGSGTVELNRGDVLELVAASAADPSGTRIRADKPVQVLAGHSCAYVPSADVGNCDHLEESMLPEDTLGSDYLVTLPVYVDGTTDVPTVLRVAAIAEDTQVSFDPALRAPLTLAAGEIVELKLEGNWAQHVRVSATKPLLVASYMVGQDAIPGAQFFGDPSMSMAVASEQFRREYLFTAPITYSTNFANVVAQLGASVSIDGESLPSDAFEPIGQSGYGVARKRLDAQSSVHTLEADREVGLTVYGYGQFTSYMYPGGADLERITIPEVF